MLTLQRDFEHRDLSLSHTVTALQTSLPSLPVKLEYVLNQALLVRLTLIPGVKTAINSISGYLLETDLQKAGLCSSISSVDGFSLG